MIYCETDDTADAVFHKQINGFLRFLRNTQKCNSASGRNLFRQFIQSIYRNRCPCDLFRFDIECADNFAYDMIPVILIQKCLTKVAGSDQNDFFIEVETELIRENLDQIIDIISVTLLAKITEKTEITTDCCGFDRYIVSQRLGHDSGYAFCLKTP